jgi:peptidoglycan/LPS O-acetylase OafA/YrhL
MSSIGSQLLRTFEAISSTYTGTGKPKMQYIDCLRGYAVLMVITTHMTYTYLQLPNVVHRIGAFGWYGVQLFFLASCLTLMMSLTYERAHTCQISIRNFFIRRFLRIAPMYYIAGIFYFFADPAAANATQALSAVFFLNGWHPATMPANGGWQLVPGGWSIGVEFTFYFLFPLIFAAVTSLRRAVWFFIASVIVGTAINSLLLAPLSAKFGFATADNFLYFWFFNQAPVFAFGSIVFFAIQRIERSAKLKDRLNRNSTALIAFAILMLVIVALAPVPFGHILLMRAALPQYIAASTIFAASITVFSQATKTIFINKIAANLGKVSFSAYLLHFAVIEWVLKRNAGTFHITATGWTAIGWFALGLIVVLVVTYLTSFITYSLIELPMMRMAKLLTRNIPAEARPAS